jgi:KaiC domain protein
LTAGVSPVSSDDDWFERAFADDGSDPESGRDSETAADADGSETTDGWTAQDATEEGGSTADVDAGVEADEQEATDSPFADDFSAAFNRAPTPAHDGDFDGESMGGSQPSVDPFGDDGPPSFDSETMAGFSTSEFDEEEFESQLSRIKIGIEGLDDMVLGGIPKRSLIVTIGSAGTGKTTIGMQFLNTALENGERAVYISLEESRQRVMDTAEEKGMAFRQYEQEGSLAVVDLDPVEMANSLSSIRNDLTRLIDDFDAERLVLDSVSLLEMMYDHPARRRSEVFQFTRSLKDAGVTTLVTSEANDVDPFASRHGIIEYLSDAVFILQYVRSNNFQETRLAIEIQKIRDANHSRQPKPYEITSDGISVHQQANLF